MADPFATATELAARWRPLSVTEQATATTLLGDASAMIRVECPDVDVRLTAEPPALDAAIPKLIACAMVKRSMIAGADAEGISSTQQAAGPFSQSQNYANPLGNLYLTKAERRMLGCGGQRAGSVQMGPRECAPPAPWWVTP